MSNCCTLLLQFKKLLLWTISLAWTWVASVYVVVVEEWSRCRRMVRLFASHGQLSESFSTPMSPALHC